jgi:hypothetical protein
VHAFVRTARRLDKAIMDNLCDGSRRPVRGTRHQLETSANGHMEATCPVCKRRMTVRRVLGIIEFPRHESGRSGARR